MDGEISSVPSCWGPRPGRAAYSGSSASARLTFTTAPSVRHARTRSSKELSSVPAGTRLRKVRRGSAFESTTSARSSSPSSSSTPIARPCSTSTEATPAPVPDGGAAPGGGCRQGPRHRAHPAAHVPPRPVGAVELPAELMVGEDPGRSRMAGGGCGPDDPLRGERPPHLIGLEERRHALLGTPGHREAPQLRAAPAGASPASISAGSGGSGSSTSGRNIDTASSQKASQRG